MLRLIIASHLIQAVFAGNISINSFHFGQQGIQCASIFAGHALICTVLGVQGLRFFSLGIAARAELSQFAHRFTFLWT